MRSGRVWSSKTAKVRVQPAVNQENSTAGEEHLERVRQICAHLPDTTEKLSHGEHTFFVRKKVYAMFANNHHNDGHIAVWLPAPPGLQGTMLKTEPQKFFRPPYMLACAAGSASSCIVSAMKN
jgi:hypothetical protein